MDTAKLFAEAYHFPCYFDLDHQLRAMREFNKILIRSNKCTIARVLVGLQHLLLDMQHERKKEMIREIIAKRVDLIWQSELQLEEQKQVDAFIEKIREQKPSQVQLLDIENFTARLLKDVNLKKHFSSLLSPVNIPGMIFTTPMQYQKVECITNYPNMTHAYYLNQKSKGRNIEGTILWNLASLKGIYFSNNLSSNTVPVMKETMADFQKNQIQARKNMIKKMWGSAARVCSLVRFWGYDLKREGLPKRRKSDAIGGGGGTKPAKRTLAESNEQGQVRIKRKYTRRAKPAVDDDSKRPKIDLTQM
jgi:hypothetical protein